MNASISGSLMSLAKAEMGCFSLAVSHSVSAVRNRMRLLDLVLVPSGSYVFQPDLENCCCMGRTMSRSQRARVI